MRRHEFIQAARPESLVEHVTRGEPAFQRVEHGHGGAMESIREASHRGHRIVIRTTYRIEVDGISIDGHIGVTNDGRVHYHAVPNLDFASAVDLVKQLIDTFPADFPTPAAEPTPHQELPDDRPPPQHSH